MGCLIHQLSTHFGRTHIIHPFSVGDIDADAVDAAELIGTVAQGIQPQLAIPGQVLEGLGERIQP